MYTYISEKVFRYVFISFIFTHFYPNSLPKLKEHLKEIDLIHLLI